MLSYNSRIVGYVFLSFRFKFKSFASITLSEKSLNDEFQKQVEVFCIPRYKWSHMTEHDEYSVNMFMK